MRGAFARTLTELAEQDPRVFLLTGDLGYMALEPFAERFPERFINVGVAEQNMVGIATGLAEAGYVPFVYSIVTFATLRPYEFIRNGPILHRLPVRIVGVGGGVEYGHNGMSHYGLEDVGVLRVQPGITIIAPADHEQTKTALLSTWNLPGPIYYRLGKDDKTVVPGLEGRFSLGRAEVVKQGGDILLITMGGIATETVAAAAELEKQGVCACVLIVSTLNPPPEDDLAFHLGKFTAAVAVEAHYAVGGLGSLLCEVVAGRNLNCRVIRCAVKDMPDGRTGSQAYMYSTLGLSRQAIVEAASSSLRGVQAVPVNKGALGVR
ncbi:MAG TPA: transketolase C-terminal domain-containing protein [Candidatus Obscuribacterales bacterium]